MKNYIKENFLETSLLPKEVKIVTISGKCKLGVEFNIENIFDYIDITNLMNVQYRNNVRKNLLNDNGKKKISKKKLENRKKDFQNQVSIALNPKLDEYPNSTVSTKIFKNGSLQFTGFRSVLSMNRTLNIIIDELSKDFAIISDEDNKIVEKPFIKDNNKISLSDFEMTMINSNFNIGFKLKLYNLYELIKEKIESDKKLNVSSDNLKDHLKYDPDIHAAVIYKLYVKEENSEKYKKKVSFLIFEKGPVNITGVKSISDLIESYEFIKNLLLENKEEIESLDIQIDADCNNDLIKLDDDENLLELALKNLETNYV
jgi:TATA-box binding protein (TBP) (component of TFIID and TFIIIB)